MIDSFRIPLKRLSSSAGFTLVELAIVLIVVALLLGGMMVSLTAQYDQRNYNDTQKQMSEIVEALTGYAASHAATVNNQPYLPCPDIDNDGIENRAATPGACTSPEGSIPWADLGVGQEDAWGNRFRYRVTSAFSNSQTGFALSAGGTLDVCSATPCAAINRIASDVPVVIISHGKNGLGAFNRTGTINPAPAGADEIANTNVNDDFVSHVPSSTAGNEFDDLVVWLSPNILFNRMIAAGRLP